MMENHFLHFLLLILLNPWIKHDQTNPTTKTPQCIKNVWFFCAFKGGGIVEGVGRCQAALLSPIADPDGYCYRGAKLNHLLLSHAESFMALRRIASQWVPPPVG